LYILIRLTSDVMYTFFIRWNVSEEEIQCFNSMKRSGYALSNRTKVNFTGSISVQTFIVIFFNALSSSADQTHGQICDVPITRSFYALSVKNESVGN